MPTDKEIEAAARTLCKSGRFETGEGTCSFLCMEFGGDVRKAGCRNASNLFGKVARAALEAAEKVRETE